MKIIYLTNKDVKDENLIPNYLRKFNDEVIILKNKFDLNYVIKNSIDFIVSDRTRFLITSDIVKHLEKKILFKSSKLNFDSKYASLYSQQALSVK